MSQPGSGSKPSQASKLTKPKPPLAALRKIESEGDYAVDTLEAAKKLAFLKPPRNATDECHNTKDACPLNLQEKDIKELANYEDKTKARSSMFFRGWPKPLPDDGFYEQVVDAVGEDKFHSLGVQVQVLGSTRRYIIYDGSVGPEGNGFKSLGVSDKVSGRLQTIYGRPPYWYMYLTVPIWRWNDQEGDWDMKTVGEQLQEEFDAEDYVQEAGDAEAELPDEYDGLPAPSKEDEYWL